MIERVRALLGHRLATRVVAIAAGIMLLANLAALGPVGAKHRAADANAPAGPSGSAQQPGPGGITPSSAAKSPLGTLPPASSIAPCAIGQNCAVPTKPPVSSSQIPHFGLLNQGIAGTQIRLGFSYNFSNCGDAAALVDANPAVAGDPKKTINTFAQYINDNHIIPGHTVTPVFEDDGGTCSEKNQRAADALLSKSDNIFMAFPGLHVTSDYLIAHKLPVFGGRDDPAHLAQYGSNGLQVIEPQQPSAEAWASFGKYYLHSDQATPCLIRIANGAAGDFDTEQKTLETAMSKYGLSFGKRVYVFPDDPSQAEQIANNIAVRAKSDGCDHAYFMAGNVVGLVFITSAATKNQWFPKVWTCTARTFGCDDDTYSTLMDQTQWANAKVLTYRVPAGQHPMQGNCKNIYDHYNPNDGQDTSAPVVAYCAEMLTAAQMMRRAVLLTGTLTSDTLMLGASDIKDDFFYDATVPMDFKILSPSGPFKTRGFSFYTVGKWNVTGKKYDFPEWPCYYRTFGPGNGGCVDLRPYFAKAK